jgi:hypothetical protein
MTQAEVEGSDSKKTQFRPETTEPVYVKQAYNGHYSPSYACRSVNPLPIVLLAFLFRVLHRVLRNQLYGFYTHKDQGLQKLY